MCHSASETFFGKADGRIGGIYQKVIYKEYTDDTFTTPKPQTPDTEHLGLLGKGQFHIYWKSHSSLFVLVLVSTLVFNKGSLNTCHCSTAFAQVQS